MTKTMRPENLQEAVWLLLCGAPSRQKLVASKLGVSPSCVSKWAHGDSPVSIETVFTAEDALGVYPVTEFMTSRMGRGTGVGDQTARARCAKA